MYVRFSPLDKIILFVVLSVYLMHQAIYLKCSFDEIVKSYIYFTYMYVCCYVYEVVT